MTRKAAKASKGRLEPSVDVGFRRIYRAARARISVASPLLVAFEDKLVLVRDGKRVESVFTPPLFHGLKMVAHVPIAVFVASGKDKRRQLRTLLRGMDPLLESFVSSDPPLGDEAVANVRAILARTRGYLARKHGSLAALARTTGPLLLRCTRHATELQLAALDGHATKLLSTLSQRERNALEVVVAGVHQARQRSLVVQYFARLLGEHPEAERRLSYAEGASSVEDAILLVGTRRLDREIGRAFFGDPFRLQRDILGDAAKALLGGEHSQTRRRAHVARVLQASSSSQGKKQKGARHGYDEKSRQRR
jgi:hypothetical protein